MCRGDGSILYDSPSGLLQGYKGGLAGLTQQVLGHVLNKQMTMSNWSARPLRESQLIYAALDAWACVAIYDKLITQSPELQALLSQKCVSTNGTGLIKTWHTNNSTNK